MTPIQKKIAHYINIVLASVAYVFIGLLVLVLLGGGLLAAVCAFLVGFVAYQVVYQSLERLI